MPKPQIPAKQRQISGEMATMARYALADNLIASTFYFSFCPEFKAAHVGWIPRRGCSFCDRTHPWLELTRDEVKEIADKKLSDKLAHFIDEVNIHDKV